MENQIGLRIVTLDERNKNLHDHTIDHKAIKVLDKGFVRLVDHMGDDAAIVQKARVSYGAGTKAVSEDEGLIRYLLRNKHTSPFEGVIFKFHVRAPLFVFRQWQRHRMWSYNEMSGRYSEMPEDCFIPEENTVTTQNPDNKQGGTSDYVEMNQNIKDMFVTFGQDNENIITWSEIFADEQEAIKENYDLYLKSEMRKELARINLPLSQYSEMYATVDLHNLFHFLKLRQDSHAQYEIRVFADAILELIRPIIPISVKAYEDYILNGMYFSAIEQKVLKELLIGWQDYQQDYLDNTGDVSVIIDSHISNKRERTELLNKLNGLK